MSSSTHTLSSSAIPGSWLGRLAAGATLLFSIYWGAFALTAPVTVWDSHTYNLARIVLAEHGGPFAQGIWNDVRQVFFPWSFDAVHYPFVRLIRGWGVALPSFACFIGTLIVVWRMVRDRYGAEIAWLACVVLFAMPTLVFQATSTKNDIPLVFAAATWLYASWQWHRTGSRGHLLWAALALGFMAGSKSSGVPLAALLGSFTALRLFHTNRRALPAFLGAGMLAILLLGSVETYINNLRSYGAVLGPVDFIEQHRNRDGIRGTAANLLRYTFGNLGVGYDFSSSRGTVTAEMESVCRNTLASLGLRNVGYRPDFDDEEMRFLKSGWEAASDYGLVGALALVAGAIIIFRRPARDPAWRLAVCGWISLTLISATTAWMPWNSRFLLVPFVCFALAFTLGLTGPHPFSRAMRWGLLAIAFLSAIAYPMVSFNKKPSDLIRSVTARDEAMFAERPATLEVYRDLGARAEELRSTGLALVAGGDTWVFPFYNEDRFPVFPLPNPTRASLLALAARSGGTLHVVGLSRPDIAALDLGLALVKQYTEPDSALYVLVANPDGDR